MFNDECVVKIELNEHDAFPIGDLVTLVTVRAVTVEFFVSIVITFCSQTFVA
jgi:hypothetical protein